jgi:hypothetical protein
MDHGTQRVDCRIVRPLFDVVVKAVKQKGREFLRVLLSAAGKICTGEGRENVNVARCM